MNKRVLRLVSEFKSLSPDERADFIEVAGLHATLERVLECWNEDLDAAADRPRKAADAKRQQARERYADIRLTFQQHMDATGGCVMAAMKRTATEHRVPVATVRRARKDGDSG